MNIYLSENKKIRDDTLEPAYLKDSSRVGANQSLDSRVTILEEKTYTQDTQIEDLTTRVDEVEASLIDLPEGRTVVSTIKSYVESVIGKEVPNSIITEQQLAAWLSEQENGQGITLNDLNEKMKTLENEIITVEEVENLVNSLP